MYSVNVLKVLLLSCHSFNLIAHRMANLQRLQFTHQLLSLFFYTGRERLVQMLLDVNLTMLFDYLVHIFVGHIKIVMDAEFFKYIEVSFLLDDV